MKKILKSTLSIVLASLLIFSIIPLGTLKAEAITPNEVKSKLNSLISLYPPGSSNPQSNCWYFVNMLSQKIFGHNIPSQSNDATYKYYFTDSYKTNFIQIGSSLSNKTGNLNTNNLKNLLSQAQPGDVIQMDYTTWKGLDSLHVMMVYSASSTGAVFYHAGSKIYFGAGSGSDKLNLGTNGTELTWSQLMAYLNSYDDGISLYRSKKVSFSGNDSNNTNTTISYPVPTKTYQYTSPTMKGDEVRWIQTVLCDLGYPLDIDGSYGKNTTAAVQSFQSAAGLTANGICDANTVSVMKKKHAEKNCSHSYTTYYESSHPHKEYKKCSKCNYYYYTGGTQKQSSCATCYPSYEVHVHFGPIISYDVQHPHQVHRQCSCGTTFKIDGETTTYAYCSICNPSLPSCSHKYSSEIDSTCNLCGKTRTITYTGWADKNGKKVYYEKGKLLTNRWINYKGTWYYVDANGYRKTDCWQQGSKGLCYLTKQGYMATNCWVNYKGTWYYVDAYGYRVTNKWVKGAEGWCWLTKNGYMTTNGWIKDTKGWCYINDKGYAVSNCWKKGAEGWCWLGKDNYMVTNKWVKDTKGWCFVNDKGYAVSNCWKKASKGWCWIGKDNYMVTNSWVKDAKGWAFVDKNGHAVSNCWKKNANGWFYIGKDNYIVTNTSLKIDGIVYHFNKAGVCLNP